MRRGPDSRPVLATGPLDFAYSDFVIGTAITQQRIDLTHPLT